jgi:hypothetical protein
VLDQDRRTLEAEAIRDDAATLPADWHFLLAGDFNIQNSDQEAYQVLVGLGDAGAGRFFDPIKRPGDWNNEVSFRFVHTQDPSGAGGMDDRHDQILVSANLIDAGGVDYVGNANVPYSSSAWDDPNHSYRSWGNDGSSFNAGLRVDGNTMVGPTIAQALIDVATSTPTAPWAWATSCTCSPPGAPAPDAPRTSTMTTTSMSPISCSCWPNGAPAPDAGPVIHRFSTTSARAARTHPHASVKMGRPRCAEEGRYPVGRVRRDACGQLRPGRHDGAAASKRRDARSRLNQLQRGKLAETHSGLTAAARLPADGFVPAGSIESPDVRRFLPLAEPVVDPCERIQIEGASRPHQDSRMCGRASRCRTAITDFAAVTASSMRANPPWTSVIIRARSLGGSVFRRLRLWKIT